MRYQFATLDPRNVPAAQAANDKVLENLVGVLGIEVTVPSLAGRCTLGNIDPQHSEGKTDRAAIEEALTASIPPDSTTLVTVRADLDSVGAMTIIDIRGDDILFWPNGEDTSLTQEVLDRVKLVAESDRFARGGWPGKRSLPNKENPWPEETATAESFRPLAAIAAAVADFKVSLEDRVALMHQWLLEGEEPKEYRERVEKERMDMVNALETGEIEYYDQHIPYGNCPGIVEDFDGVRRCDVCMTEHSVELPVGVACEAWYKTIAVVQSTHRAATSVGYALAPVVVALNPSFRFQGGEPHAKYTVCQFTGEFVDLKAVATELNEREPGWGGSPTIIGSPQGVSSKLTIDEVVGVVERHLK